MKNTPYYLLFLLGFFPLMPYGVLSVITILFVCTTIIFFWGNFRSRINKENLKPLLINISFFLLLGVTWFYSNDKENGTKELLRGLNFLIFPVILLLFFPRLKQAEKDKVFKSFVLSNLILVVYLSIIVIKYTIDNIHLRAFSQFPFREIIMGKTYLDLHPTYLCLWFAFSLLYLLNKARKTEVIKHKVFLVALAIMFYGLIILIAARTVFIALNFGLVLSFVVFYKKSFTIKIKMLLGLIVVAAGLILLAKSINLIEYRFFDELKTVYIKEPRGRTPKSISIRYGIYNCNFKLFKSSPVFGYGVGSVQNELNKCYESYKTSVYKRRNMDSHNYFFYLVLSGGVLVLMLFIWMLSVNFTISFKNKDFLYFTFLVLIFVTCLTENILYRAHGNMFFTFLNAIFLSRNYSLKQNILQT